MRGAARNGPRGSACLAWISSNPVALSFQLCARIPSGALSLLLMASLAAGCAQRDSAEVASHSGPVSPTQAATVIGGSATGASSPTATRTSSSCRAACDRAARGTFAAWFGFDPADGETLFASTTSAELLAKVQALAATKGKKVVARPIGEFLAAQEKTEQAPAIFVSTFGHYLLFVGTIKAGKDPEYEIVHGNLEAALATRRRLEEDEHVNEVWTLTPAPAGGIPIHVGNGEVTVSKLIHNFGEIRSGRKYEVAVGMKNTGTRTVVLKKAHTICGCTKPQYAPKEKPKPGTLPDELLPGETTVLTVGVELKPVAAVYLPVTPILVDKESGVERQFDVQLVAFQRETLELTPKVLDFGTFAAGSRPATRILRVAEVPSDRFRLKRVEIGTVPVSQRITEEKNQAGLSTFRIELMLDPDKTGPGTHAGDITVVTDSDVQPTRIVPVSWRKKGHVEIVPPVLSFGAVRTTDSRKQKAQLLIPGGDKATFELTPADRSLNASVTTDEKGTPVLVVEPKFSRPGSWNSKVTVHVHGPGWNDSLDVPVVAYVLGKS
jgi:hypothetical protein